MYVLKNIDYVLKGILLNATFLFKFIWRHFMASVVATENKMMLDTEKNTILKDQTVTTTPFYCYTNSTLFCHKNNTFLLDILV